MLFINYWREKMKIISIIKLILPFACTSSIAVAQENMIVKEFDYNYEPSGTNTLYYSYKGDASPDIFIKNDQEEINLTNSQETWDIEPDYSPDGSTIIYSSGSGMANMELRIMNADGSNNREFYSSARTEVGADWSPDGERVIFSAIDSETKAADIMIVDKDGRGVKNLTEDLPGASTSPSWSPDGKVIIFANKSSNDGQQDIYVMDVNGGHKKRITNTAITKMGPIFTPNGQIIVYGGKIEDDAPVHLYAISATNPKLSDLGRQLTKGENNEYLANFTPNGLHMTYSTGEWARGFKMGHQPIPNSR